jgi:hypothetical protein
MTKYYLKFMATALTLLVAISGFADDEEFIPSVEVIPGTITYNNMTEVRNFLLEASQYNSELMDIALAIQTQLDEILVESARQNWHEVCAILVLHALPEKKIFAERFQEKYGYWRDAVDKAVASFLECGIFEFGFAQVHCKECGYSMIVPFSCKGRCFLPELPAERAIWWAEWLNEEVLAMGHQRQFVFTIPKILRRYFLRNRSLLGELTRCAWLSIKEFFAAAYPDLAPPPVPAAVFCIQIFGNLLSWNPHIHSIVASGCFAGDTFHAILDVYLTQGMDSLTRIFRAQVIAMLRKEGVLSAELAQNILHWQHNSGFSVYSDSVIAAGDKDALENLAHYIIRNSVSQVVWPAQIKPVLTDRACASGLLEITACSHRYCSTPRSDKAAVARRG